VRELEAGGCESGGNHARAGQQGFVGHCAKREAKSKCWGGKNGGAMNGAAEGAGELRIGYWVRGGQVHRARKFGRVQGKQNGGNRVGKADPAHPLATGAEAPTQAYPEQGQHLGQCAARADYDSEAKMDHSNAGVRGWLSRCFPLPA
jgi:hypothetical protein